MKNTVRGLPGRGLSGDAGALHNLPGDTNVVSVRINDDGSCEYVCEARGDTVADILSYVQYHPRDILKTSVPWQNMPCKKVPPGALML